MTVLEERIIPNNGRPVRLKSMQPRKAAHAAPEPPGPSPVPREVLQARRAAEVITSGIVGAAFVLSFAGLFNLAQRSGIPWWLAWLWPLIVDGTIVQATVAIRALAAFDSQQSSRRFFWAVLVTGASVSVGGNILHAWITGPVPPVLAAAVAAVAPLALLAATHGMAVLARFKPENER